MLSTICIYWLDYHRQINYPVLPRIATVKHCGGYLEILPGQVYELVGLAVSVQDILADPEREKITSLKQEHALMITKHVFRDTWK